MRNDLFDIRILEHFVANKVSAMSSECQSSFLVVVVLSFTVPGMSILRHRYPDACQQPLHRGSHRLVDHREHQGTSSGL